ncbi:hypothetical protein LWI28_001143 [Acer negundo]|uniref:Uncharacterized protein n=1 Tax=Acer negundo TaxID=4023 RepID=A0AAD5NZ12_ACENE|nr:hypothetical protein LWI28_001143 [Acer negundo]
MVDESNTDHTRKSKFESEMMKKAELIFVPLTGTSHLAPTLEFASNLMDSDDRISITVLLMKVLPFGSSMTESVIASHPRIRFIDVPQLDYPPAQLLRTSPEGYFSVFSEKNTPHVKNLVRDIIVSSDSSSSSVTGLVVDLLLISLIDAAIELNLPCYTFSPFSGGFVSLLLYLSTRDDDDDDEFQYSDSDLIVPGFVNPVPVSDLDPALFNKDGYIAYIKISKKLMDVKGVILNTFSELEQYSLNSFSGGQNPTVYTVGPLLHLNGQPNSDLDEADRQKILKWLDDQPETSVVFLCFGTAGNFSPAQVKEIATGLEQSECRFLWSLRVSSPHDRRSTTTNNDDVLPEGFMERELGLSVEMRLDSGRKDDGDHIVAADEIARAVRCAMDGDSGIRKKVKEMSEIARKSMLQGGSSFESITRFIDMNF